MKHLAIPALILSVLLPSIPAMADDNVEELYLYRSHVMKASSSHLKALKYYVEGNLAMKKHVPFHIDALVALSDMYQDLFPAGNQHPESESKPIIWSDPRGFKQATQSNRQRIMALKQVDPGDIATLKRVVNEVRMSCGDCHYYYRER